MDSYGTDLHWQNYTTMGNVLGNPDEGPLSWPLADCKSACEDEDMCGGFTFYENESGVEEGVCYFKQTDASLKDLHHSALQQADRWSTHIKCGP